MTVKAILFDKYYNGRRYLFSPAIDFLMAGGGSLVFMALVYSIPAINNAVPSSHIPFWVAISVFAGISGQAHAWYSYQLLYENLGRKIREFSKDPITSISYIFVGIALPVILLIFLFIAGYKSSGDMLFYGGYLVAFLVGWHFTKQCYGVWIYLSAIKGIFYSQMEKDIMKYNIYFLWLSFWVGFSKSYGAAADLFGTRIDTSSFDTMMLFDAAFFPAALKISVVIAVYIIISKHWRDKSLPSFTALSAYFATYSIFGVAQFHHPVLFLMAPLFHALQYIHFVWAYKMSELKYKIEVEKLDKEKTSNTIMAVLIAGVILAYPILELLPPFLDEVTNFDIKQLTTRGGYHLGAGYKGAIFFSASVVIFTNLMHYFTDAVIWRKGNKDVGKHLFYESKR